MLDRWRPLWALLLVVGGGSSWQMDPRRVEEALNRSVFAYDGRNGGKPTAEWDEGDVGRSARRFLRSYLWDPLSSVLILDGKMIVDKRFLEGNNNKCKKHAGFVVSMLAEFHTSSASGKRGLPNSAYKFSTSSIPRAFICNKTDDKSDLKISGTVSFLKFRLNFQNSLTLIPRNREI